MLKQGLFITLEGGEGSGKTTLIRHLNQTLISLGLTTLLTFEPGGSSIGATVRSLLLYPGHKLFPNAELFLFLANRAQHVSEVIRPALERKEIILCDRYNDSTIAYQGYGRALPLNLLNTFCSFATQDLQPDLTLYLDIDPAVGLKRVAKHHQHDRIEAENIAFHTKIRQGFLTLAEENPQRIKILDATQSVEQVQQQAQEILDGFLLAHRQ